MGKQTNNAIYNIIRYKVNIVGCISPKKLHITRFAIYWKNWEIKISHVVSMHDDDGTLNGTRYGTLNHADHWRPPSVAGKWMSAIVLNRQNVKKTIYKTESMNSKKESSCEYLKRCEDGKYTDCASPKKKIHLTKKIKCRSKNVAPKIKKDRIWEIMTTKRVHVKNDKDTNIENWNIHIY